ncbi:MAG: ABC transporter substrate-binding protein [Clostridia bacterium]
MQKHKLTVLMLALLLAVGTWTGCAKDGESSDSTPVSMDSSQAEESSGEPSKEGQDPVNIVWFRYGINQSGDYAKAIAAVEEEVNAYLADTTGVTVTMKCFTSADYGTQLNLALASNEEMDVCWTSSAYNMCTPNELYKNKAVMEIGSLLETVPDLWNSIPEDIWESTKYDGGYYYVPNYKETGTGYGVMINNRLIEKYGWDVSKVTKLEDLEPFLEQVKDEVTIPFNAGAFRNYYYDTFSFITDYAGVRQDDLTTAVSIPESEEFKAHVSLMWDWYQKGYIPDWLAVDQSSTSNYLTGESGDYAVTPWNNVPDNEGIYYSQKGHYGTFVQFSEVWLDSNSALGSCYAINAKSSKAEAAIKFIEALETDRTVGDLAVFGQKDVNYTVDSEGFISKIPDTGYAFSTWAVASALNVGLTVGRIPLRNMSSIKNSMPMWRFLLCWASASTRRRWRRR